MIALFLSNLKEKNQARKYQTASIETIKNEVEANYSGLKEVMEKQTRFLDTIKKYINDHIQIGDLISKASGIPIATLSNTGLEFYKRNEINSIDFDMMSSLIGMNTLSTLIDSKLERCMDYLYPNLFVGSRESKEMVILHLSNVLESETQLTLSYEKFIDDYTKTKHNKK